MCVAVGSKPLSAFDQSQYGKGLVRRNPTMDLNRIRQIIQFAKGTGVQIMTTRARSVNYMKSVAFKPNQRANALKLLVLLHTKRYPPGTQSKVDVVYFIGKLLGYTPDNIKKYIRVKYNEVFTAQDMARCNGILRNFNPSESSYARFFDVKNISTFKP